MKRKLIILVGSLVGIIVVTTGVIVTVNRTPKLQNTIDRLANINHSATIAVVNRTAPPAPNADRTAATVAGRAFAERFGSGSNQNPEAILSAAIFSTPRLGDTISSNVATEKKQPLPVTEVATVTQALVVLVVRLDTTSAALTVTTQRQQTTGAQVKTQNQDLQLTMLKQNGKWLVDIAVWKPI